MNRFVTRAVNTTARRTFFTPSTTMTPSTAQFNFQPQQQFKQQQQQQMLNFTPQLPQLNFAQFNHFSKPQQQQFKFATEDALEFMNRNKRAPKKANHGARPCSSVQRSKKKLRRHHYPK